MDKNVLTSENTFENLKVIEENTSTNLRVATFCVVTNVNKANKTINAQPLIKEKVSVDDNNFEYVALPELVNVPYCTNMKNEPEIGEFCVCIHLDRSINGFTSEELMKGFGKNNENKHNISDCVAITGFKI